MTTFSYSLNLSLFPDETGDPMTHRRADVHEKAELNWGVTY